MRNNTGRFILALALVLGGCATAGGHKPHGPDDVSQAFFDDLQRSKREEAYNLFARGLSQNVSYEQFDRLLDGLYKDWGHLQSAETVVMPFHERPGESNFIPLRVKPDEVRRYVYAVKFERAEMNFDVTLALQDGEYKICWFSIWGSEMYLTQDIRALIEDLFSGENPSLQR